VNNPVMHWQILSKQPDALEKFYSSLFGWQVNSDNPLGYKTVKTGSKSGIDGGIWPIAPNEGHSMVQLFIQVEDVKAYLDKAKNLGGTVVIPPQVLPGGDEMAVLVDPDGIPFAIFKSEKSFPE
jgi:predicted enzyme related to lactoylglutathione lyase